MQARESSLTKNRSADEPLLPPVVRGGLLAGRLVTLVVFTFVAGSAYSSGDAGRGILATVLAVTGLVGAVAPWSLARRGRPRPDP